MTKILFTCENATTEECAAMHTALVDAAAKHEVVQSEADLDGDEEALRISMQILRREPSFLIARLVWSGPGKSANTSITVGPDVELGYSDLNRITVGGLKQLAKALLAASELPI